MHHMKRKGFRFSPCVASRVEKRNPFRFNAASKIARRTHANAPPRASFYLRGGGLRHACERGHGRLPRLTVQSSHAASQHALPRIGKYSIKFHRPAQVGGEKELRFAYFTSTEKPLRSSGVDNKLTLRSLSQSQQFPRGNQEVKDLTAHKRLFEFAFIDKSRPH